MIPFTGLTTVPVNHAGVIYVNVFDTQPAPVLSFPNVFVLRVGKGNFAQLLMNNAVALAANDLVTGAATITWPAATAQHALYSPEGVDIPPPR